MGKVYRDQLRARLPKLAAMTEDTERGVLAPVWFTWKHRTKIHATCTIERLDREIKRRSDALGIFPNDKAPAGSWSAGIARADERQSASAAPDPPQRGNQRKARRHLNF